MNTRVKLCGITSLADAKVAAGAGAWAIGMILTDRSPRRVDVGVAAEIGAAMRRRVEVTGVWNTRVDEITSAYSITIIQLPHGKGKTQP